MKNSVAPNHYSATITAEEFAGKSKVEQHKMVYRALEGVMDGSNGILHALALQTKIKQETGDE
jgi:stress-induced morphogen